MMRDFKWSRGEKQIAKKAFGKAYERECADLAKAIQLQAERIKDPADIWRLQHFLNEKVR